MPQDLLTALFYLLLGGLLNYAVNQLPSLKQFRGSGILLVLLVIEISLLVWIQQVSSAKDELYQAHQVWFDNGKLILFGALAVNLLLIVIGLLRPESAQAAVPQLNLRDRLLQAELEEVEKRRDDSLHREILIDLKMTDEREQVGRPSKQLIANGTTIDLPAATRMIEVFRNSKIGGRLLILGDPGAGKTTMLLELAKALLETGQQDPDAPVPVILELSTWREDQKALTAWLIEQLWQKYKLDRNISREWLASGQILPLLDGLDELGLDRQSKAMTAINQYLEADAKLDLVVCCRWEEYQEAQSQLSQLNGAVRLQSLTDAQIQLYLSQLGKDDLWHSIQSDSELLELAKLPLLLHILVIAYQGQPIRNRQDLFNAYILRRFDSQTEIERRKRRTIYPKGKVPTQPKTCHYLVSLAKQMRQNNQTEFWIEKIQPDWLEPFERNWYYNLPLTVLFIALPTAILIVLAFNMRSTIFNGLFHKIDSMNIFEKLYFFVIVIPVFIFGFIHFFVDSPSLFKSVRPLETIRISTQKPVKSLMIRCVVFGFATGTTTWIVTSLIGSRIEGAIIAGGIIGLIGGRIWVDPSWSETTQAIKKNPEDREIILMRFRLNLIVSQCFCCVGGIFTSLLSINIGGWKGALINGFLGIFLSLGMLSICGDIKLETTLETRRSPNQGIKASIKNAIIAVTLVSLIQLLIIWKMPKIWSFLIGQTLSTITSFLSTALIVFLVCGGFANVKHLTLRLVLWCNGYTPWDYDKFLKYAAELRLIQQVGGRYRFIHRLLRDHFAAMR